MDWPSEQGLSEQTYQLLEALLPGVWVFMLLWADLVEPAWLRVHHGTRVLKHLHV